MATSKSNTGTEGTDALRDARGVGKAVMDSAQQIWLAGLGAFARAQAEGSKVFDSLVREGEAVDAKTREYTQARADEARGSFETTLGQMRERGQQTWGTLEKVFEERLARTLKRLGVPTRSEVESLGLRVEELSREVRRMAAKKSASAAGTTSAKAPRKTGGA